MRIMCIGGGGFVGSRLSELLFTSGYDITVVDTFWFGNHLAKGIKSITADAADLRESDLVGYDVVIWLAGLSTDGMADFAPMRNFVENAAVPVHVAYMSKKAGVKRFIHAGSCSSLGFAADHDHDETSPVAASFGYGISKGMCETGILTMVDEKFSVISFRQGTISGVSSRMRFDLLINTMYRAAVVDRVITVNNPTIWRPVLGLSDAIHAYMAAIDAAPEISGIFNLVSENTTILDVALRIKRRLEHHGYPEISLKVLNVPDVRNYRATNDKACVLLGFIPFDDVESIVDELHDNRESFQDFDNPNYINLKVFKELT